MTIGVFIAKNRRAAGLTQSALARRAFTAQSAISRIECDRISPTFETAERLLNAMGRTLVLTAGVKDDDA